MIIDRRLVDQYHICKNNILIFNFVKKNKKKMEKKPKFELDKKMSIMQ